MDKTQVQKLADLARIRISDAEAEKLSGEFAAILGYVGEVKEISNKGEAAPLPANFPVRNVMREDSEGHASGIHTEKILAEAPAREGDYVKVKKILG